MDSNIKKLLEDNFDSPGDDDDIDEEVLEDELKGILSGKTPVKPSNPLKKPINVKKALKPNTSKDLYKNVKTAKSSDEDGDEMAAFDIDNIHNLLKTFDVEEDDDDEEIDENDPDLLSELSNVLDNPMSAPKRPKPSPLQPALVTPSNSAFGESTKLTKPTEAAKQELKPTPESPKLSEKEQNIAKIKSLQIEYKRAALKAKTNGDKNAALTYLKVSKQLDSLLNALNVGEDVDMSSLPPMPQDLPKSAAQPVLLQVEALDPAFQLNQEDVTKLFNAPTSAGSIMEALEQRLAKFKSTKEQAEAENNGNKARRLGRIITQIQKAMKDHKAGKPVNFDELPCPPGFPPIPIEKKASVPGPIVPEKTPPMILVKQSAPVPVAPTQNPDEEEIDPATLEMNRGEASKLFNAPISAGSVLEALEQRLAKFKSTKEQAINDNNANKARRLGRIVNQIEKAIKDYKAGKPVDFEELPCPPGFPPIPIENKGAQAIALSDSSAAAQNKPRPQLRKQMSTNASKQLNYLLQRQKLFREAAIEAKKRGEIEQAKEYLRSAKGFDVLIEATKSGLPIDATTIPTPPQLSEDFLVVTKPSEIGDYNAIPTSMSSAQLDAEHEELYEKVAQELKTQIEMCIRNREYFLKMGDIPTSSKFEKYAADSKKDLHMLMIRRKNGDPIPSYRVEERTFSIVVANLDVPLNKLHVEVIRAFDFSGTPQIDTYVRADFPFPSENPQWKRTKTFYDSLTPEYNDTLFFDIDRKSRSLPRILKRHPLKLTVYSKGCVFGKYCSCLDQFNCSGFFRSDNLIGTVLVKLNDLETKCTIHECSAWTQGRKVINGRLEVKVKIREPLLSKEIKEIKEKWIVFS